MHIAKWTHEVSSGKSEAGRDSKNVGVSAGLDFAGIIEVSVKDQGVGLSKENLKHVFEEGWQFQAKKLQVCGR